MGVERTQECWITGVFNCDWVCTIQDRVGGWTVDRPVDAALALLDRNKSLKS